MFIKKTSILILLVALVTAGAVLFAGCGGGADNEGENKKDTTIKIGHAPYGYEVPVIEVTKQIAEERGYDVEVVEGDIGFMFMSVTQGDIDIWPGVWLPSIHKTYQEKYGDQYELGSAIFEDAPLGWAVPEYVDVDSIEDLKGNEEVVNGKLIGLEPGSGMMLTTKEMIDAYDLDLELVTGTTSSMMAEVDYAFKHDEPILFLGWRPHTMMQKYDVKIIDDPKGFWAYDSEYWAISDGFKEKAPDMYNFCQNYKMNLDEIEQFLFGFQEEDKDEAELAEAWIEENRSQIDQWLEDESAE